MLVMDIKSYMQKLGIAAREASRAMAAADTIAKKSSASIYCKRNFTRKICTASRK